MLEQARTSNRPAIHVLIRREKKGPYNRGRNAAKGLWGDAAYVTITVKVAMNLKLHAA